MVSLVLWCSVAFRHNSWNVSAYHTDLQFADSFILKSKDVPKADDGGKAWLVDRLLDSTQMRKFSGTNRAGANTDFAGKTCDAFAHFVLIDSGLEFVPTDIQGT